MKPSATLAASVKGSSAVEVDAANSSFIHLRILPMKYSKVID